MPATPARIGFIREEFRRSLSTTAAVQTRYGSLARESDDPVASYLDSTTNAQAIADERQALLGVERRRFGLDLNSITEVMALSYIGTVPLARYTDTERSIDRAVMVSEITLDLGRGKAEITVWG